MATAITISPVSLPRGPSPGAVGVSGTGFAPGERIRLVINNLVVCACTADLSGAFSTAIPNPGLTLGCPVVYLVNAPSVNGLATATLTVT